MPGYTKCTVSALALAKMSRHAGSSHKEVMGMAIGSVDGCKFIISDAFAIPVEATETRVNAMGEAYEYIVKYMDSINKSSEVKLQVVGWYHSHPGYGCFLSQIDMNTQQQNQKFQDPFVAIVIDPLRSQQQNKIEIGVFRVHESKPYALEVSLSSTKLSSQLITLLDQDWWVRTVSESLSVSHQQEH